MPAAPVPGTSFTVSEKVEGEYTAALCLAGLHERFIADNRRFMEKLKGQ